MVKECRWEFLCIPSTPSVVFGSHEVPTNEKSLLVRMESCREEMNSDSQLPW